MTDLNLNENHNSILNDEILASAGQPEQTLSVLDHH